MFQEDQYILYLEETACQSKPSTILAMRRHIALLALRLALALALHHGQRETSLVVHLCGPATSPQTSGSPATARVMLVTGGEARLWVGPSTLTLVRAAPPPPPLPAPLMSTFMRVSVQDF